MKVQTEGLKLKPTYTPYRKRPEEEQKLPIFLVEWLESLTDEQAKIMWDMLDGVSLFELDMVDAMLDAHPNVVKANEEAGENQIDQELDPDD